MNESINAAPIRRVNRDLLSVLRPFSHKDSVEIIEYISTPGNELSASHLIHEELEIPVSSFFKFTKNLRDLNLISSEKYEVTTLGQGLSDFLTRLGYLVTCNEYEVASRDIEESHISDQLKNRLLNLIMLSKIQEVRSYEVSEDAPEIGGIHIPRGILYPLKQLTTPRIGIVERLLDSPVPMSSNDIQQAENMPGSTFFKYTHGLRRANLVEVDDEAYRLTPLARYLVTELIYFGEADFWALSFDLDVTKTINKPNFSKEKLAKIRMILMEP